MRDPLDVALCGIELLLKAVISRGYGASYLPLNNTPQITADSGTFCSVGSQATGNSTLDLRQLYHIFLRN